MKLYYQDEQVTIYNGHCREFLESVKGDVIITDPPYGETSIDWDWRVSNWPTSARETAKALWCFGSFRMFFEESDSFLDWSFSQEIVWEKHNGSGMHTDRFRRVHELAAMFYRGEWAEVYKNPVMTPDATKRTVRRKMKPTHWNDIENSTFTSEDGGPRLMRSVMFSRSSHGEAYHPTQKPLAILDPLIRYSCPPAGTVIDPFMGSGSTLVAAKRLGMRAIGCDIKESYCQIAVDRLRQGNLDLSEDL